MRFMEAVRHVFTNYANFKGRARRSEYWYFYLFNVLLSTVGLVLSAVFTAWGVSAYSNNGSRAGFVFSFIVSALLLIYGFASLVPGLAVVCRRLHDVDKPGSYILFGLIPVVGGILILVWVLQDSVPYDNQYGPCPKQSAYPPQYNNPPQYSNPPQYNNPPQHNDEPQFNSLSLQPTLPANRNGDGAKIMGVVGEMRGRSFTVSNRMTIGRMSDCGICYTAGGVSRQHCELNYSGGTLYIRDLGSTYGTIINERTRLEPNKPIALRPGDRISLGSSNEVLQFM